MPSVVRFNALFFAELERCDSAVPLPVMRVWSPVALAWMLWGVVDGLAVRELGEDDVESLIACIRRCYGESYTELEFYDAEYVRAELRAGRLLSVGALDGTRVVGHVGTRVRARGDVVAETVCGVVDPDYRGRGLIARVGGPMTARYGELGIAATMHFATGARAQHR